MSKIKWCVGPARKAADAEVQNETCSAKNEGQQSLSFFVIPQNQTGEQSQGSPCEQSRGRSVLLEEFSLFIRPIKPNLHRRNLYHLHRGTGLRIRAFARAAHGRSGLAMVIRKGPQFRRAL